MLHVERVLNELFLLLQTSCQSRAAFVRPKGNHALLPGVETGCTVFCQSEDGPPAIGPDFFTGDPRLRRHELGGIATPLTANFAIGDSLRFISTPPDLAV
ncbi:MAG: hypothetical protein KatS3mg105_2558 [Gemmatales bacterium]|nr:MAG: hypothetical protein KatS3mg105_2558 [Gemmatales bacterium]